jgi:hypothetical protein
MAQQDFSLVDLPSGSGKGFDPATFRKTMAKKVRLMIRDGGRLRWADETNELCESTRWVTMRDNVFH